MTNPTSAPAPEAREVEYYANNIVAWFANIYPDMGRIKELRYMTDELILTTQREAVEMACGAVCVHCTDGLEILIGSYTSGENRVMHMVHGRPVVCKAEAIHRAFDVSIRAAAQGQETL